MVTIVRNGVSLSASATLNGFPLRVAPRLVETAEPVRSRHASGPFAKRKGGMLRRAERRFASAMSCAFLAGV